MKGLLILPLLLLAQTTTIRREAVWEHSGLDVNGNPDVITVFEVGISTPVVDLNTSPQLAFGGIQRLTTAQVKQADGTFLYAFGDLISQLGDGTYTIWVRAEDESGNQSAWTKTDFRLDKTAPAAPANLKVRVVIEIVQ